MGTSTPQTDLANAQANLSTLTDQLGTVGMSLMNAAKARSLAGARSSVKTGEARLATAQATLASVVADVQAAVAAINTPTPAPTPTPTPTPAPSSGPLGVPGNWTNVLNTLFTETASGASAVPTGWTYSEGVTKNGEPVNVANFSQSGGYGLLAINESGGTITGFEMQTTEALFLPGMVYEMVLNFSTWNNWGAGWSSGVTWPMDGEWDSAEVYNGKCQCAYHYGGSSSAERSVLVGNYSLSLNTDYTFTTLRSTSSWQQYLNGQPFGSPITKQDDDLGHYLKVTQGLQGNLPAVFGAAGALRVKRISAWAPAS